MYLLLLLLFFKKILKKNVGGQMGVDGCRANGCQWTDVR